MCGSCPSRNELSVSGYEDLYRCLSKTDRRPYLDVSLAELSGLINYSLQHRQAASYRPCMELSSRGGEKVLGAI